MQFNDKDYQHMQQSITKALVGYEMPLKEKHARATIIATFKNQGATIFWSIALRQPIMDNRISAWKFCHLLHKVLREGHNLCCPQSVRNVGYLNEMGKLWGHLSDGYGICILQYTKLLVTKIDFHDRNIRFPANLTVPKEEFEQICGTDPNHLFQLAIDIYDYLDVLIGLQATIFNSIQVHRVNSMTNAGQCRLAALIPCIQDCNPLYDYSVRLMFKLHANLPHDVLEGHRKRFDTIFKQLKLFYQQAKDLQYFVNLITVPKLPKSLPNFVSASELGQYVAPTVIVPEVEQEPQQNDFSSTEVESSISSNLVDIDFLVDTKLDDSAQQQEQQKQQSSVNNQYMEQIVSERDDVIQELYKENQTLRTNLEASTKHYSEMINNLQTQISTLTRQCKEKDDNSQLFFLEKEQLLGKITSHEKEKLTAEEKFVKIKAMYTQIREEHINLLRQNQEASKHFKEKSLEFMNNIEKTKQESEREITVIKEEYQKSESSVKSEYLNTIAFLEKENHNLKIQIEELKQEIKSMSEKNELLIALKTQHDMEYQQLLIILEQKEDELTQLKLTNEIENKKKSDTIASLNDENKNLKETFEREKGELQQHMLCFETTNKTLQENCLQTITNLENTKVEKENLETKINNLLKEKQEIQTVLEFDVEKYQNDVEKINKSLAEKSEELNFLQDEYKVKCEQNINLQNEITNMIDLKTTSFVEFSTEKVELENKIKELMQEINKSNENSKIQKEKDLIVIEELNQNLAKEEEKITLIKLELKSKSDENSQLQSEITQIIEAKTNEIENFKIEHKKLDDMLIELEKEKSEIENNLKSQCENNLGEIIELKTNLEQQIAQYIALQSNLQEKDEENNNLEKKLVEIINTKNSAIDQLKNEVMDIQASYQITTETLSRLSSEKTEIESELQDLLVQHEDEIKAHTTETKKIEEDLLLVKIRNESFIESIIRTCIGTSYKFVEHTTNCDNTEVQNTHKNPNYFMKIVTEFQDVLAKLDIVHEKQLENIDITEGFIRQIMHTGHQSALLHVVGLNLCNNFADIETGENSSKKIKIWASSVLNLIDDIQNKRNLNNVKLNITKIRAELTDLSNVIYTTSTKDDPTDQLSDLIESELITMDKSIDEASKKIEEMMAMSRESNSGIKLEINEKILDSCTNLMKAIRKLIQKSKILQAEIVSLGKGSSTVKEFYKKNHQWTEGMISAAKNVAQGANYLVKAADKSVSGVSKHQLDLIVAAQEIAASTAQLVVASRVKAARGSQNLNILNEASKQVAQATASVVAVAKDSDKAIEDAELEFANLTVHQAKTIEMEMQVKILELEQHLQNERHRLMSFRKKNYSTIE